MMGARTILSVFGLCLLLCASAGAELTREEQAALKQRAAELEKAVAEHKRQKSKATLMKDVDAAVKLHKDAKELKAVRGKAVRIVGGILGAKDRTVKIRALRAIGEMKDPSGGKYLKPYLKQSNPKKRGPTMEAAIEAAGLAPNPSLVPALLRIVKKSKDYGVAAQAMRSLGKYGDMKSKRKMILTQLVKTVAKDRPGVRRGKDTDGDGDIDLGSARTGEEAQNRWQALSATLTPTLNELTGRKLKFPEEWFQTVKSYKNRLDAIFTH